MSRNCDTIPLWVVELVEAATALERDIMDQWPVPSFWTFHAALRRAKHELAPEAPKEGTCTSQS